MSQSSSKIEAFPAASVLNGVRCLLDFQQASQLDDVGLASTCKHKQIEITLKHLEARITKVREAFAAPVVQSLLGCKASSTPKRNALR